VLPKYQLLKYFEYSGSYNEKMVPSTNKKKKNILLISVAGGGGHIQAANGIIAHLLKQDPNTNIIQKDILLDWMGKILGKCCLSIWNLSQKRGNISILKWCSQRTLTVDFFFGISIFLHAFLTLIRNDIDQIIDTQPIGTAPIIKAIKWANKITHKSLKLEKIVTELPTEPLPHFFAPIKHLSACDRRLLKLSSTAPLLKNGQTAENFWQQNCGLSEKEVHYKDFPLRPAFRNYMNRESYKKEQINIQIKTTSPCEKFLITGAMKRGAIPVETFENTISLTIEPEDKIATILLGSQPNEEATIKYVKNFIFLAKQAKEKNIRHFLFVFCDHHPEHKHSLLRRVHDAVQKSENYPSFLSIIPMCFQEDEVIASLFYRSDATFTRSGGLTSMELLSVAQGQIWIHSETKYGPYNNETLSKGVVPIWERGNAFYLQTMKGAQFITPETFLESCVPYF
jgi:hypothetical protein